MNKVLIFLSGMGIGGLLTAVVLRPKIIEECRKGEAERMAEIREFYRKKFEGDKDIQSPKEEIAEKEDRKDPLKSDYSAKTEAEYKDYAAIAKQYANIDTANQSERKEEVKIMNYDVDIKPIDAKEFISVNGRKKVSLTLYLDDVLADTDTDEKIDAGITVGYSAIDELPSNVGAYLFRHNSRNNTDYEIVRSDVTYEEATGLIDVGN